MSAATLPRSDQNHAGYTALAAAILRSGFQAVYRPDVSNGARTPINTVRAERLGKWLFLFTKRAQLYADAVDLDLPTLRAIAWEEGIVLEQRGVPNISDLDPSHHKSKPFSQFSELWDFPPGGPDGAVLRVGRGMHAYPAWSAKARALLRDD